MTDESGILGNLPRSRPGRRSARREGDAPDPQQPPSASRPPTTDRGSQPASVAGGGTRRKGAASRAAPRTRSTGSAQPRRTGSATASRAASDSASTSPAREQSTTAARAGQPLATTDRDGTDILTGAARAAGDVATIGVRVAAKIAGEAMRRLPKP